MFGYFFLGINALIVILITLINMLKPPSGQNGMGFYSLYAFLYALYIAFAIFSLILTLCVEWKSGFDWVSDKSETRNLLVGIGWLFMVVATLTCAFFKWEWHPGEFPQFLRWLSKSNGQTWIPLLMLVPYYYLLSAELRTSVPSYVYKMPLTIAFGLTTFMVLGLLFGQVQKQIAHKKAVEETKMENLRKYGTKNPSWALESSMNYIMNYKEKTITGHLLSYASREKEEQIRTAAIAKMKSYEYWETDLIHILEGKQIEDIAGKKIEDICSVYRFLDGNTIEHRGNFIQPIKNSLTLLTSEVKNSIKDADNYELARINFETVCRVLDTQFKDSAAEFRPSLLTLQQVLDTTPAKRSDTTYAQGFNEVLQKSRIAVKNWLDANP
jgi:hypothetical protein